MAELGGNAAPQPPPQAPAHSERASKVPRTEHRRKPGQPASPVPQGHVAADGAAQVEMQAMTSEHATAYSDTSRQLLKDNDADDDGPILSDEWVRMPPLPSDARVATFTEKDFPHAVLPKDHPEIVRRCAAIDEALFQLDMIAARKVLPSFAADPEAAISRVQALLPDPEDFRAGGLTRFYHVWEHLLRPYIGTRRNVKWVLRTIKEGVRWGMVTPINQTLMPNHKEKLARVHRMLAEQVGPEDASKVLRSPAPPHIKFPNHASTEQYPEFVADSIAEAVRNGALRRLAPGQVPCVTASLGVADNKAPKLRMVIDPALVNLMTKYEPLRYEQLADMRNYVKPGDYATTTDEKSGYYHIPLHPSMWTYYGICWEGQYYVFTHMAFGIGPACRTYTVLKQELFRVLRDRGSVRMSFLIDDQCNVAQGKPTRY